MAIFKIQGTKGFEITYLRLDFRIVGVHVSEFFFCRANDVIFFFDPNKQATPLSPFQARPPSSRKPPQREPQMFQQVSCEGRKNVIIIIGIRCVKVRQADCIIQNHEKKMPSLSRLMGVIFR